MRELQPLGDRAFLATFADDREARDWAEAARRSPPKGVVDVVLAYHRVAIFVDREFEDFPALENALRRIVPLDASASAGKLHRVPVLYDGADLVEVAQRIGKAMEDVIALHAGREYDVKAVGFLPGFAYAGDLPPELAGLPRRDCPRTRVDRGSVAIAGRQTGIYPSASPGGWHLLGRTPLEIVNVEAAAFPILAGDRILFLPIDFEEYRARLGERL